MSVERSWETIHTWLNQHHPTLRKQLRGPADPADFAKLEQRIKQTLPADFKASYLIHNGSKADAGPLIGLPLLSLAEIGRVWKGWADIGDDDDLIEDLNEECESYPEGAIKLLYANRNWLPFAGDSQNHVAIDFDPGPNGKVGQIINCGRDDMLRHVIADTFEEFLAFVAQQFANGRVTVDPDEGTESPYLRVAESGGDLLTDLRELLGLPEA